MKRLQLSTRGPEFSHMVYGTWRLLDSKPTAQEINRRLNTCLELGITTIDTAEIYGLYEVSNGWGRARAVAGAAEQARTGDQGRHLRAVLLPS